MINDLKFPLYAYRRYCQLIESVSNQILLDPFQSLNINNSYHCIQYDCMKNQHQDVLKNMACLKMCRRIISCSKFLSLSDHLQDCSLRCMKEKARCKDNNTHPQMIEDNQQKFFSSTTNNLWYTLHTLSLDKLADWDYKNQPKKPRSYSGTRA